ncbi:MAG: hypothetical protein Q4C86_09300 [bacterium]|nr:hypothetical protein [bacterium]
MLNGERFFLNGKGTKTRIFKTIKGIFAADIVNKNEQKDTNVILIV